VSTPPQAKVILSVIYQISSIIVQLIMPVTIIPIAIMKVFLLPILSHAKHRNRVITPPKAKN
jgi:hypothetical protein